MLRLRAQVLLPLDVVALRLIEDEDVADVVVRLRDVIVIVGPGEPAAPDEPVEIVADGPLLAEVGTVFDEAEGEDVYLPVAPCEQGRQVRAQ